MRFSLVPSRLWCLLREVFFCLACCCLLISILYAAALFRYGSVEAVVCSARGARLHIEDPPPPLAAEPGGSIEYVIPVVIHSSHPVTLVGCTTSCGCATGTAIPQTIPARSTAEFRVRNAPPSPNLD
jgi:hypothetical protein